MKTMKKFRMTKAITAALRALLSSLTLAALIFASAGCSGQSPAGSDSKAEPGSASASVPVKEAADSESSPTGASGAKDRLAAIKERGYLSVGTSPDFPPNEFYILDESNQRKIVGSDIELAQAIADRIGVELKITETDFNGVLANIQAAQVDMGISGFAATEARKESMQFSDGYFRTSSSGYQGILTTSKIAEQYPTLEALKAAHLSVGAQAASLQCETALRVTDADKIKQLGTLDALALALEAGDLDAVAVSTDSAAPMLDTFTDFVILPKEGFDLDPEGMYATNVIGFPMGEDYQSLIGVANTVIAELKASDQISKWVEDYKAISLENMG